ncbi:right-handed parallel beta-helix repeat-containing protein [Bartonella schoenbuchensis]|uniref:right-handed parallel beta-helix repeat-containing protein n=1 Tax=Bartonella schoenbuchensis TaxID=165694 RepID=UPI003144EAF8
MGGNLTVKGMTTITGVEMGIWVKGGSLTVKEGTTITGVKVGIAMKGKGELKVEEGTRIEFTGSESYDYGVYVGSSVSKASLTGVTITGNKSGGSGVLMMGSTVTMTKVNISNVGTGVYAMGGSLTVKEGTTITEVEDGIKMMGGTLTVEKGARINFTGEHGYGIYVGESVRATLTDVTIEGRGSGNGNGYGVYAEGGSLTVSGGSITGVKAGIFAVKGGTLTVEDSTTINFMGSDGYGVYVGEKVRAKLLKTRITGSGDGYGIEVAKGGAVWLKETHLRDVAKGMTISKGVTIMEKGSVEFTRDYGIDLTRGYAFLGGVNIEGKETGQEGIRVNEGMLDLYKTNVRDVYKGMTVWKGGIRMFGGSVEFTGDYGIDLTRGYAFLGEVNIEGKETGQEGIKVSEGMLNLYKTNVRDVYKGMTVKEGSVVRMFEGEITFKGEHAISLTKGYVDLRKVRMTYTSNGLNANFIKVEGGKVLAEEVTITGNGKGQGVKVANGGAVWLKKTTFTNVRSGMTVGRGVLCAWREDPLPLMEAMVSMSQGGRLC